MNWAILMAQGGFHREFTEHFDGAAPEHFTLSHSGHTAEADYRYTPGAPSLSEKGTSVMLFRIDPDDPAGAGKGPEIISRQFTHYGTYSARLRIPAAARV